MNNEADVKKAAHSRRSFLKEVGAAAAGFAVRPVESLINQRTRPELSPNAGLAEVTDFISRNRERVDYGEIWPGNKPVLFLGERHTLKSDKDELIRSLAVLKRLGLTHVAMEMFQQEHQNAVDSYFEGRLGRDKIFAIFMDFWNKRPGIPEKYMELVDAIKAQRLRLLAIDIYTSAPEYSSGEFFRRRNRNWASLIGGTIREIPDARILVYNGQSHSGYNLADDSANEILKNEHKVESVTLEFAGGEAPGDTYFFVDKIATASRNLGVDKDRFGVPISSKFENRPNDYIVHLPQIERA